MNTSCPTASHLCSPAEFTRNLFLLVCLTSCFRLSTPLSRLSVLLAPRSPTFLSLLAAPVPPLLHAHFTRVSVKTVEDVLLRWLRRSPPPQAQESTEEPAPRGSLPDSSQSRSPIPKLQRQLQVHLHRLPDNILRSSVCTPAQLVQIAAWCAAQPRPPLSCALTRPARPQTPSPDQHKTLTPPAAHQPPPRPPNNILTTPPKSRQSGTPPTTPLSPRPQRRDSPPTSPTQSIYSLLFHRVKDLGLKPPTPHRLPQSAGTSLRGSKRKKPMPNEEAEGPVSGTMVKNGPRTDSEYVLRSQNPAESASANSQTGLTNGVPHKGLLQSKHKIRVDFKVSFFVFVALPRPHPIPIILKNISTP